MKAKVIRAFYDLQDPARKVYSVGDPFEGSPERVKDLEKRGYVKQVRTTTQKKEK